MGSETGKLIAPASPAPPVSGSSQAGEEPASIIRCDQCRSPYKEAIRVPGKLPIDWEVENIESKYPAEAERFKADKRNLCGDCYFNCLYEMKNPEPVLCPAPSSQDSQSAHIRKSSEQAEIRTKTTAEPVPPKSAAEVPPGYPPAGRVGGSAGKRVLGRWLPMPPDIDWEGKNRKTVRSGVRPTIYCQWTGNLEEGQTRGRQLGQFNPDEIIGTLDVMSEPERSEYILRRVEEWKAEKGKIVPVDPHDLERSAL